MLGSMYDAVITQSLGSIDAFINVVKAVAAYYFLWRSTYSNSGLDSTYRDFFKRKSNVTV